MFKPRLRIPRASGLLRPSGASAPSIGLSVPVTGAQERQQQRSIHATPRLNAELPTSINLAENEGVKKLYSPEAADIAWTQYQTWVINELNRRIGGTNFERMEVKQIAVQTSREPGWADLFNYASMAHNNEFFFTGIAPKAGEDPSEKMSNELQEQLEKSFGSLETLQREMLQTANAMFGPGFVWLVRQTDFEHSKNVGHYRVLTTYLAGSPYPDAHWRRQGADMNTVGGVTDATGNVVREYYNSQNTYNKKPALHSSQGTKYADSLLSRSPGGANLHPVLCVNTWQHAWLPDYGFDGKVAYLSKWWDLIHWGRVAERSSPGPGGAKRLVNTSINVSNLTKSSQL